MVRTRTGMIRTGMMLDARTCTGVSQIGMKILEWCWMRDLHWSEPDWNDKSWNENTGMVLDAGLALE